MDGGLKGDTEPHTNLEYTLREKKLLDKDTLKLDAIIVTHPDGDHIGGINRLIENYTITCPIIATEATEVTYATLQTELPEIDKLIFPTAGPKVYNGIQKKLSVVRKDTSYRADLNESSILFTLGKFQLTGDSMGKHIAKLGSPVKCITVFQVPHHGSKFNSFIPYDTGDFSEDDLLYQLKKPKHPAYKYALFYRRIQACTYFISYGNNQKFQHPHRDVVTGIIIAAVTEKKKYKIVVTGTFGKNKIDYPDETKYPDFPQNWQDYVEIHVPEHEATRYITITADGAVSNTKLWEPTEPTR